MGFWRFIRGIYDPQRGFFVLDAIGDAFTPFESLVLGKWTLMVSVSERDYSYKRTFQESFDASPQLAHIAAAFAVEFANQCGLFEGGRGGD